MKISVCIASYNGERFIRHQLESILPQLSSTDEVIISDDNSKDGTLQRVKDLNDPRIKVFVNEGRSGPVGNFENALSKATGDYIFLSDQDDVWYPAKVETCVKGLQSHDLVTSDCHIVDDQGKIVQESYFEMNDCRPGILYNLYRNSYLGCCMAFTRKLLDKSLPFPKRAPMHDIWIGMVGECFFEPLMIEEKLMGYRRHGDNYSTATSKSKYSFSQKISFRINVVLGIVGRYFRSK